MSKCEKANLQSTTDLHHICFLYDRDPEVIRLHEFFKQRPLGLIPAALQTLNTQTHILTQTQSDQLNTFTSFFINLTNGGLAEFPIRHLVGDICSHQHAHLNAQLLVNDL